MSAYPQTPLRRRARLLASCALAVAIASPAFGQAFQATPTVAQGTVFVNQAEVIPGGQRDTVTVLTPQSVINWRPTDTGTGGGAIAVLPQGNELVFTANTDDVGSSYTVLNRIIPDDPSRAVQFEGLVRSQLELGYGGTTTSGGSIWFYSPGGIILGANSRFDVGNLVLSANDIDFSGGLFGTGTSAQTGTIRFRGDTDSRSSVAVMPGAQISASGNYLAIVAPRVSQDGTAVVEGSAALVAAENLDMTIPVSDGLFSIFVSTGSNVANAGDTTLTHSGTTETRDTALSGATRRLYLMAVPKNEAVTMLVSGNLGYSAAQQAQLGPNGAVYLTTGQYAYGDTPDFPGQGNIRITGGNFGGQARATAQNVTIDTTASNLNFSNDLTVYAGNGTINVAATNAHTLTVGGNAYFSGFAFNEDGAGSISVSAGAGSTFQANSLTLNSSVTGAPGNNTPGGTGTGGTQSLTANGGIITVADYIEMNSTGYGSGDGNNSDGGNGFGGAISVTALNNGQISATNSLGLYADGYGGEAGYGGGLAGSGTGGSVTLQIAGGGRVESGNLYASARGYGAYASYGETGGNGNGGIISATLTGGRLQTGNLEFSSFGQASGGESNGTGGTIAISSTAGSSIAVTGGDLALYAVGASGDGYSGVPIGNATGGSITFVSSGSGLTLDEGALIADASGQGGYSYSFAPATNRGGSVSVTLNAATPSNNPISMQQIQLTADGYVNESGYGLRDSVPHGSSATGVGGSVLLAVTGGPVVTDSVSLSATGTGANGDYGEQAGAGFGGRAELRLTGGTLTVDDISVRAEAYGGDGAFGESGYGGPAGDGGNAGVGTNPFGANAGAYVTGTGGSLNTNALFISANATGGYGGDGQIYDGETPLDSGRGGDGRGGTASIATTGVAMTVGQLYISANGGGGDAGEVHYPAFFYNPEDNVGGAGGSGTGGLVNVSIQGGDQSFDLVRANADGTGGIGGHVTWDSLSSGSTSRGGNGGSGFGGQTNVTFTNANLSAIDGLSVELNANGIGTVGGTGAQGGDGGDGRGGMTSLTFDGGTANVERINLNVYGQAGDGRYAERLDGGNGGDATGGIATFTATNGATVTLPDSQQYDPFRLSATAFGGQGGQGGTGTDDGNGGDGGNGGMAQGGIVNVVVRDGATLTAPGIGGGENYPPSLFVSATGGPGGFGGPGSAVGYSGGAGGDGGNSAAAYAGSGNILVSGGTINFGDLYVEAVAIGRDGGSGGIGYTDPQTGIGVNGLDGQSSGGIGGRLTLLVEDANGRAGVFNAGDVSFDFNATSTDGGFSINDTGTNPVGGIHIGSLYSHALYTNFSDSEGTSDDLIGSTARRIRVDNDIDLNTNGNINFAFSATGGLDVGGDVYAESLTHRITVTHGQQTNPLSASISGRYLGIYGYEGVDAQAGSLLRASDSIYVDSRNGFTNVANAIAINQISVSALDDVTVGSLQAGDADNFGSIYVRAGATEGFVSSNVTVTGNVAATGDVYVYAPGDVVVAGGARVVADRGIFVEAGDDILIGSGALVRAANNPPDETGYGSDDPLNQQAQLSLQAGRNYQFGGGIDGELGSIVIDGTLEAPDRTIFMSAGAVAGSPGSVTSSGNLFVRLFNIPEGDQVPSNDGGLLTGACLEGSVCLGTVNATNIVRIGEDGYVPLNLRLGGGIDAVDVLLRGQSVALGQSGTPYILRASDSLTIESLATGMTFAGPIAITGGSEVARVAASGDLTGAEATISAPGTLDLYATNNVTLGGVSANVIRTVDFNGNVVNAGGITMPGSITIGDVRSGTDLLLNAGGNIALDTTAVTGTATLRALTGSIVVATDADATGGVDATARSVTLNGLDGLNIIQATASAGDIVLATTTGPLTAATLNATGGITLSSGNGAVRVTTDIVAGGPVQASGDSISLRAIRDLRLDSGNATGDITLTSGGDITLDRVTAGQALTINAPGTLIVNGRVGGRTVGATSSDLTIGENGRLGDSELTTFLQITSTAPRMFLGDATGTGYHLDAGEFTRILSRGSIDITSAPINRGQGQDAYSLADPTTANIVIGSLVFDGSQLGGEHTLSISSPESIGIIGDVRFRNFGNDQAVTVQARNDIALATETGMVRITNNDGGLAGTLTLDAQKIHALSARARADIANMDLAGVRDRLGTNDGAQNDGGYFQANAMNLQVRQLAFIQNSGVSGTDQNLRRGFSTNSLTIGTGEGTVDLAINGRVGGAIGADTIAASHLEGRFAADSSINGCIIGGDNCDAVEPPPPPPPVYDFSNVLSASRDQMKSEHDKDEKEEALQAGQARPDPIIQFVDAPPSRFDPLVDEPVTGAGNEDYWEQIIPAGPGPTP